MVRKNECNEWECPAHRNLNTCGKEKNGKKIFACGLHAKLPWCIHDMEIVSALLALCEWNPQVAARFLSQQASDAELWRFRCCQPEQSVEQQCVAGNLKCNGISGATRRQQRSVTNRLCIFHILFIHTYLNIMKCFPNITNTLQQWFCDDSTVWYHYSNIPR